MKAYVEIRKQRSRGSSAHQFGGPDVYVAVQVVPDNVEKLKVLNRKVAQKRGIKIIYCGEGYSQCQQTSRSLLGQALIKAREIAEKINNCKNNK